MPSIKQFSARNTSSNQDEERQQADGFINNLSFLPDGEDNTENAIKLDLGKYVLPLIADNDELNRYIVEQAEANGGSSEVVLVATVNLNSRVRNDGSRDDAIKALFKR